MKNGEYVEIVKKHFKNKYVKDMFFEQIDNYSKYDGKNLVRYEVGDNVLLDSNTLVHGSRISVDELNIIKNSGLISSEFYSEFSKFKKKPWVIEFWRIDENISLGDYIKKYCGVTINVKNRDGSTKENLITPLDKIKDVLFGLSDYRDYIIYQNQEQRFLPNEMNTNATMAFVVRIDTQRKKELTKYDVFSSYFDKKLLKYILPKWFIKKYIEGGFDNYETGRERAILFGLPSSMIEGIIVNRMIEEDDESLNKIKKVFPDCYICNIEGIVIK